MSRSYPFLARTLPDRPPTLRVHRLEHFAAVQNPERTHEPGQLARLEQMCFRSGTPAEVALGGEKRFHHEEAAGGDELADVRQPRPVKIIEHQNRIKRAELGPLPLEIHDAPVDGKPLPLSQLARPGQPRFVPVDADHRRRPVSAAARLCRPSPHARSSTRVPGPSR